MSMALCKCGALIDTDADPECFYLHFEDEKPMDAPLCPDCKEAAQAADEMATWDAVPDEKMPEDAWSNCHAHDAKEFRDGR